MGANAASRLLVLPVSAVLGLVVTRLVIEEYGEADYAQYALLIGVAALIPFADLGISAALMNAVAEADDPRGDNHVRGVLVSCLRVLTCSAAVILVLTAAITVTGSWDDLLGEGLQADSGPAAAAGCLVVIAMTLTVSFGQRILIGLSRYYVVILVNGLQTPLVLLAVLAMLWLDLDGGGYVAVLGYAASFLLTVVVLVLANRAIAPALSRAFSDARRVRAVRGAKVADTALPMLVQMVALPLAMQSDRLVLSHVADTDALTEYSLAAQMYNPFVGVIATAGVALWPVFAKARGDRVKAEVSPTGMALVFGAIALVLGLVLVVASGPLAALASNGRIELESPLVIAFTAFLVVQAMKYPLGMYMTDARGLRFQAVMITAMLPVNLGLSLVLAERLGAAGPVIGSVVGVLFFQVAANWAYVRRDQRRLSMGTP